MTGFIVTDFTPMPRGTLLGFCTAQAPSGLIFHDVSIHERNGSYWAMPPSKPLTNRDGVQLRDEDGKLRWLPALSFASRQVRDRWSEAVIEGLKAAYPQALPEVVADGITR